MRGRPPCEGPTHRLAGASRNVWRRPRAVRSRSPISGASRPPGPAARPSRGPRRHGVRDAGSHEL